MKGGYPELIVIGAQKCATTSLWRYLDRHPDITMAAGKETNFFLFHHEQGPAFYDGRFDSAARVRGEACPDYTARPFSDGVAARIARLSPDARLVYVVRDPVERIVSHWRHATAQGRDPRPFREAVMASDFPDSEYVLRSRYWWQLEPFLAAFTPEQLHVVVQDDLVAEPSVTVRRLFVFAGVDPDAVPAAALEERLHLSEDKLRPPRLARALLLPRATATAAPPGARRRRVLEMLTRHFGRPFAKPEIGAAERARIWELVGPDVAALGRHIGRRLWDVPLAEGATHAPGDASS